jgi:exoribonuclease II
MHSQYGTGMPLEEDASKNLCHLNACQRAPQLLCRVMVSAHANLVSRYVVGHQHRAAL